MKDVSHHIAHYLPLIVVLFAGILGFFVFTYDKAFQGVIVVAVAASYVSWGLVHHFIHGDLNISVVIEYLAIAILGVTLVFSVLFRA